MQDFNCAQVAQIWMPPPPFGRILLNAPQINRGQLGLNDTTHGIIHCCWSKKSPQIGENSHKEVQHHSTQQPTAYLDGWTNPTHIMWTLPTPLWNHHHHHYYSTECLVENWSQGLMRSVLHPNSTINQAETTGTYTHQTMPQIVSTPESNYQCYKLWWSAASAVKKFTEVLWLVSSIYIPMTCLLCLLSLALNMDVVWASCLSVTDVVCHDKLRPHGQPLYCLVGSNDFYQIFPVDNDRDPGKSNLYI